MINWFIDPAQKLSALTIPSPFPKYLSGAAILPEIPWKDPFQSRLEILNPSSRPTPSFNAVSSVLAYQKNESWNDDRKKSFSVEKRSTWKAIGWIEDYVRDSFPINPIYCDHPKQNTNQNSWIQFSSLKLDSRFSIGLYSISKVYPNNELNSRVNKTMSSWLPCSQS